MAKLLIIDDERGIRNTLKEILADEGHTVDVAEDGKQGLEMAQQTAYDLIYSDIKMPGMDGMEVLAALKEPTPSLPEGMVSKAIRDSIVSCFLILVSPPEGELVGVIYFVYRALSASITSLVMS